MTDPRMGEALWTALERLPRGAGVVFRHYLLPPAERAELFARVRRVARRRRLVLLVAGAPLRGADGRHGGGRRVGARGLTTRAVHHRRDLVAARRARVDAVFASPVFATRSHPGAPALGRVRFGLLIRGEEVPVIALGGMNARRAKSLAPLRIHGWAAIDAWAR
ncbi:thiamine phosphate synthase [Sphingomonas sp. PL-96]|uniref:thiamine phosphate synthase n=1 Tax=Sphingomonas sp. PL-96 TaxID=2887201 RepID=UPI001E41B61A|nr:thiamine phosphate synthase [Sphingomonas sp. PL-96]MCC2977197.1 thiamine phosphate synthase [Sphingomonas sp. PL-96]